jgi:hypothetical protein
MLYIRSLNSDGSLGFVANCTVQTANANYAYMYPTVCKQGNTLWVSYTRYYYAETVANWYPFVTYSTNEGASWSTPYQLSTTSTPYWKTCISAYGSSVYCVYMDSNTLRGRLYTTSWQSEEVIATGVLHPYFSIVNNTIVYLKGDTATVIIRPNAAGDKTEWPRQYPTTGYHWDKVDDVTPDEDTTYISIPYTTSLPKVDLYNLENVTVSDIVSVTVYFRHKGDQYTSPRCYAGIKTYTVEVYGKKETSGTTYVTSSYTWLLNPYTNQPWTTEEVNSLQAGVKGVRGQYFDPDLGEIYYDSTYCTQVYVEVEYRSGVIGIYYKRRLTNVWSSEGNVSTANVSKTSAPVLSATSPNMFYCFWASSNKIFYSTFDGSSWSSPVDWITETETLTGNDRLTCFYQAGGNTIGLMYMTGRASPYCVKFAYLTLITKTWHDIALWSENALTRKWLDIAFFSENLLTRKWTDISSYILSLLTRSWRNIVTFAVSVLSRMWNAIAFWTFDLLAGLVKLWHDIVYWSAIIGDTIFANSYFKYLAVSGLVFVILFILIFEEGKKK